MSVEFYVQDFEDLFKKSYGQRGGLDLESKVLLKTDLFVQSLLLKRQEKVLSSAESFLDALHQARVPDEQVSACCYAVRLHAIGTVAIPRPIPQEELCRNKTHLASPRLTGGDHSLVASVGVGGTSLETVHSGGLLGRPLLEMLILVLSVWYTLHQPNPRRRP